MRFRSLDQFACQAGSCVRPYTCARRARNSLSIENMQSLYLFDSRLRGLLCLVRALLEAKPEQGRGRHALIGMVMGELTIP